MSFEQEDTDLNRLPAYNEKAWEKMELLLDEHLPQEKKRRRAFWLLLPLLLLGPGGAYLLLSKSGTRNQDAGTKEAATFTPGAANTNPPQAKQYDSAAPEKTNPLVQALPGTGGSPVSQPVFPPPGHQQKNNTAPLLYRNKNQQPVVKANKPAAAREKIQQPPALNNETNRNESKAATAAFSNQDSNTPADEPAKALITGRDTADAAVFSIPEKQPLPAERDTLQQEDAAQQTHPVKSNKGNISLYASAGPDVSHVGFQKGGRLRWQYGLGIGYQLSGRFTIRTGFYVSDKVYSADSASYHPPAEFWNYYTNLERIDADCKVYEIPLNVLYHFAPVKKHQWFLSAGLFSYIMKKETYGYSYKNAQGQPRYYVRSHKNENRHWLGVAGLSGGYSYRFSKKTALVAEPYVRLPLRGVGFGNVRLQSAGLLLTFSYQPFGK
ncbi:MAG TPA: hypothetical protein PKC69_07230 [Chitinophagaceae bacterium]|mgnify:CR=1 FL=1|nr:hypothetical protein [Chitinophagaceae bacterium]